MLSRIKKAGYDILIADHLLITMGQIERMNPTLIIIGNKRSAAFWGHHPKYAWMDYDFADRIPDSELPLVAQGRNLEVYQNQLSRIRS